MKCNEPPLPESEHEGEGRNLQLLGYNVSAFDTRGDGKSEVESYQKLLSESS